MCNNSNCSHDNLDDDFSDLFGGAPAGDTPPWAGSKPLPPVADDAVEFAKKVLAPSKVTSNVTFEEKCRDCRGTGRFVGYTGRVLGDCYKCKGTGVRRYKTSTEQREKAAEARDAKRARDEAARDAKIEAFKVEHAEMFDWMHRTAPRFEFAGSMLEALNKYGHLTEKQFAAVERCVVRDAERDAQRKVEREQREASAPTVDTSFIETAFAAAQGNGIKKPKMILNGLKFSIAPAHGVNAGALYVVRVADDQYLGKIKDGKFMRIRECTEAEAAEVARVASDPKGEAIAYGQRTGNCCICNRELTNHASIDAGIGPICASRFGW